MHVELVIACTVQVTAGISAACYCLELVTDFENAVRSDMSTSKMLCQA